MLQAWFNGLVQFINTIMQGIFMNRALAAFFGGVPLITFFIFMLCIWIINQFYSSKDDGGDT